MIVSIEKSPLYPLPPDYTDLTPEGQRKARVNACRLWLLPGSSPYERGLAFVAGVRFFDSWYLKPDHDVDFDPLFYDDAPLPDPDFHYHTLNTWGSRRCSITIAPRGSAKSFLIRKAALFRLLSRPAFSITYATSSNDNAKVTGQAIKGQLVDNSRIHTDWGPECPGGQLLPRRGEAPFGTLHMQLKNGSWIRCLSAESKMRGGRPLRFVLDDPEYDPKASTSMQLIRDYMERLLFKIIMPMIMRKSAGVDWLATFVSKRHYAWHATSTEKDRAIDPRFSFWERTIVRAAYDDPTTGREVSCWPEMWPLTRQCRLDLGESGKDLISLEEVREAIGTRNFLAEYMANPGEGDMVFFPELTREHHGWEMDLEDDDSPLTTTSKIRWHSTKQARPMEEALPTFLRSCRLFMTVDTSFSSHKDSDYKCACLMALNHENDLFVLDVWSAQTTEAELIKQVLLMADRWKCPFVGVEAIRQGISVYNAIHSIIQTRAYQDYGTTHLPGVRKITPGPTEKVAKIAALHLRFEHGKIKLPLRRRDRRGPWRRLFNQISEFNPDAPDGGLQHDDEIDCVSMSQFVARRGLRPVDPVAPDDTIRPVDLLKKGHTFIPGTKIPTGMIDWSLVDSEDIAEVLQTRASTTDGRHQLPTRI